MCPLAPVIRMDSPWLAEGMWLFCIALPKPATTGHDPNRHGHEYGQASSNPKVRIAHKPPRTVKFADIIKGRT